MTFYEAVNIVTRPFCLVESRSQDAAVNAGVLSVYSQLFCANIVSCSLKSKERIAHNYSVQTLSVFLWYPKREYTLFHLPVFH